MIEYADEQNVIPVILFLPPLPWRTTDNTLLNQLDKPNFAEPDRAIISPTNASCHLTPLFWTTGREPLLRRTGITSARHILVG